MTKTSVAMYDRVMDARQTVHELIAIGVPASNISLMTQGPADERSPEERTRMESRVSGSHVTEGGGIGAGIGVVLGAVAGVLTSVGSLFIPSIGPLIIAGPVVGALAGAGAGGALGGIIGALIGLGVPEETVEYYVEGVCQGATLLIADIPDELASQARRIIQSHSPIDLQQHADGEEDHSPRPRIYPES